MKGGAIKQNAENDFWKFDWKLFLWDIPFILFAIISSRYVLTEENLFQNLSRTYLAALLQVMALLLSWYVGFVYIRYTVSGNRLLLVVLKMFFLYLGMLLYGMTVAAVTPFLKLDDQTTAQVILIAFSFLNLFFIPAAFYGGTLTGKKALLIENADDEKYYARWLTFFSILILWTYAFRIPVNPDSGNFFQWIIFILMILIPPAIGITVYQLIRFIRRRLEKWKLFERGEALLHIVLPLIISTLLIVFNTTSEHMVHLFQNDFSGMSSTTVFELLCIFGVIPIRLYLMMSPPVRGINLIISILALVFYIWTFVYR
jgi:hypothetical protein